MCDIEAGYEGIETKELEALREERNRYKKALEKIAGEAETYKGMKLPIGMVAIINEAHKALA